MKPGLILLLLGVAVLVTACVKSDFKVVKQEVFSIPDGLVLDCTVLNTSDEDKGVGVSGALLTEKKATADVKYVAGELGPGEEKTFMLEFDPIPFDGFLCRVQELYIRR